MLDNLKSLTPEDKILLLQTKSRNLYSRSQVTAGMMCLLEGLRELGIDLKTDYTKDEVDTRHHEVREQLRHLSFEKLRSMDLASDAICNLRHVLLSECVKRQSFSEP
jgi:hypothetical protein